MYRFLICLSILLGFLSWLPTARAEDSPIFAREIGVANTALDERLQAVAHNSVHDEYLVIWQVDKGAGDTDLWGRRARMIPFFTWITPAFAIAATSTPEQNPAVVFNPSDEDYLVVFEQAWSSTDVDIYGQRVAGRAGGGDNGGELKGNSVSIGFTNLSETQPAIAYLPGSQSFLAVYTANGDIWGQRLARYHMGDGGGDRIGSAFVIASDFEHAEGSPTVVAGTQQSYFLVTYSYQFTTETIATCAVNAYAARPDRATSCSPQRSISLQPMEMKARPTLATLKTPRPSWWCGRWRLPGTPMFSVSGWMSGSHQGTPPWMTPLPSPVR